MSLSDPIADMLTRIRNASSARHDSVLMPASKIKIAIANVLKEEGFIKDFSVASEEGKPQPNLKVDLSYGGRKQPVLNGLKRVSKPGLRVYVQRRDIREIERISKPGRRVYSPVKDIPTVANGLGVSILSTPKGVMSGQEARRNEVGGEVICYVW